MSRSRTKSPEALQQDVILQWLAAEGICAYRMNSGAMKLDTRFVRFGVSGMADVLAFPWFKGESHPRALWIEVKSATGRQRPEQTSFAVQVEERGMHYLLARGVHDLERWLQKRAKADHTASQMTNSA